MNHMQNISLIDLDKKRYLKILQLEFFLLVEMETNCVPAVTARGDTDGDQGTQERDPRI